MTTFQKFADAHGVTLVSVFRGIETHDDKAKVYAWTCTLAHGGCKMSTPYFTSLAHARSYDHTRTHAIRGQVELLAAQRAGGAALPATAELLRSCDGYRADTSLKGIAERVVVPSPPKVADLLECLNLNARCGGALDSFEAYCSDMDENPDSRAAKARYHACQDAICRLIALLGAKLFAELMDCTDTDTEEG
jgi:hypothetical protein